MKHRTPWEEAARIARTYVERLAPYCERIEVAGSVRRRKAEVGDIEIVAIPRSIIMRDLFGLEHEQGTQMDEGGVAALLEAGAKTIKNGPRYKQFLLPEGVSLDLFLVRQPAQWGVLLGIRTGPSEVSQMLVSPRRRGGLLPAGYVVRDGAVWQQGYVPLAMPEEEDFFKFLGLPWIAPEDRNRKHLLQALREALGTRTPRETAFVSNVLRR